MPLLWESAEVLLSSSRTALAVLLKTLRQYSHFGIYSSPAGLINTVGIQLPNLILASAFGAAQLGQLALAQRLLLLPAGLIGSSVGKVFLSQAADRYRSGSLPGLICQASQKLFIYGLAISILASLFLAPLMPVIFGQQWGLTRWIIPLLTPLFVGATSSIALASAMWASQKMFTQLALQSMLLVIRVTPLLIVVMVARFSFMQALAVYSVASMFGYCFYFLGITKSVSINHKCVSE